MTRQSLVDVVDGVVMKSDRITALEGASPPTVLVVAVEVNQS